MQHWQTRTDALTYLESNRQGQLALTRQLLATIDECIDAYESAAGSNTYCRVCGLTLVKAKHLAVGAYSLALDGLAQEAGALLRPFIEYTELLTYFRKFPQMVDRALENDLPKAGERARAIEGVYKGFRDHLNTHASHSSYSHHSLAHLLEPRTLRFKKTQRMVPHVLDRNLQDLTIQVYLLLREAVLGLEETGVPTFEKLASVTDDLRARLIREFDLSAS